MADNGWISTYRSIRENWVWEDKPFAKGQAWVDLLLRANHEDVVKMVKGRPHKFGKGTVSISQRKLAEAWGWSRTKVIHFLHDLETTGMIEKKTTDYTTIKLVNWDKFQEVKTKKKTTDKTTEQTTDKTTGDTLNNKFNNDKQEREETALPPVRITRFSTGIYDNVYLSSDEAARLMKELGETVARKIIDALSEYMHTHKHKYTDDGHYAVIMKWAKEDKQKYADEEDEEINAKQRANYGSHWTDKLFGG